MSMLPACKVNGHVTGAITSIYIYIFGNFLNYYHAPDSYSAHLWYQKTWLAESTKWVELAPDFNRFLKYSAYTKTRIRNNRD